MDWRPFADSPETVQQVLTATVVAINQGGDRLRGRSIRLQTYPFDHLVADDALDYWSLYRDIAQSGCLVVVDELSLFHEPVRDAFATSPLATGTEIAFVTLSPLDPAGSEPHVLLRDQLDGYLTYAARRFGESLDPLCELGVPERRRLERWLRGSLPRAVETLREPKQDPDKLRDLAEELGRRPNPALGRLVAGEVGQG
jgi:hypothetical protein